MKATRERDSVPRWGEEEEDEEREKRRRVGQGRGNTRLIATKKVVTVAQDNKERRNQKEGQRWRFSPPKNMPAQWCLCASTKEKIPGSSQTRIQAYNTTKKIPLAPDRPLAIRIKPNTKSGKLSIKHQTNWLSFTWGGLRGQVEAKNEGEKAGRQGRIGVKQRKGQKVEKG